MQSSSSITYIYVGFTSQAKPGANPTTCIFTTTHNASVVMG
jgi:hypothetical protein